MIRIIGNSGSKQRRRSFIGALALSMLATLIVIPVAFSASTDVSVVDYAQCANGKPTATTPPANDKRTCNAGWINGILNANNSQYAESDVTAQRLVLDIPSGNTTANHTITLRYLWNKSANHAYDSFAKWNTTISGVTTKTAACAGVPGGSNGCPVDNDANLPNGDDLYQVPSSPCSDDSVLQDPVLNDHQLSDRNVVAFDADITNISVPANDDPLCGTSADHYETVTITYTATAGNRVMFLFGGHLAASLTPPTSPKGWGGTKVGDVCTGCLGAASINGGPYHIKLDLLDGTSAGNRDNQIMSSAILPLIVPTLTTTPTGSATYVATVGDSVNVGAGATGTADFYLYNTLTDCQATTPSTTVGTGGLVYKQLAVALNGSGVATATNFVSAAQTAAITYYWTVAYSGDSGHTAATKSCSESVAFTAPTATPAGS